jgi:hypothetical protein
MPELTRRPCKGVKADMGASAVSAVDFGHDETALIELWQVLEN